MDILNITPTSKAVFLHFTHPGTGEELYANDETGKPDKSKPIGMMVIGADTPEFRAIRHRRTKEVGKKKGKMTEREIDELQTGEYVECSSGPRNLVFEGKVVDDTFESLFYLYDKVRWMREQVAEFVHGRDNFLPSKPKPSPEK